VSAAVEAYLGLGANVDDRRGRIEIALERLGESESIEVRRVSRLVETDPVGPGDQGRYLNAAAHVVTGLAARDLLATCLAIERSLGRDRRRERWWGPRPIDIDLLLYGGAVIREPGLTVPHPRMHARSFVLEPLGEIAPDIVHPVLGATVQSLRDRLRLDSVNESDRGKR
jgi:2-amino-4-hydroxy-6-hydroxymethyldihydropteridine diphosphokinase